MSFDLCTIDWNSISAIATLVMAVATFLTLRHSRKQLNEMKSQWEEEHRPLIEASLVEKDLNYTCSELQLINYGKGYAENIMISFEQKFLDKVPDVLKAHLNKIHNNRYRLLPHSSFQLKVFEYIYNPNGSLINGSPISEEEYNEIAGALGYPVIVNIEYGKEHQYKSSFELSVYSFDHPAVSSIEGQLNAIIKQISLLREKE